MQLVSIKGSQTELIMDDGDFERLLEDHIGTDAVRYFRNALAAIRENALADFRPEHCPLHGECDAVYRVAEHYQAILHDVQDELDSWNIKKLSKADIDERRFNLWNKINREL